MVKNGAQHVQNYVKTFCGGHPNKGLHEKIFTHKNGPKLFRASLAKFGRKSFTPPKITIYLLLHPWLKVWNVSSKCTHFQNLGGCLPGVQVNSLQDFEKKGGNASKNFSALSQLWGPTQAVACHLFINTTSGATQKNGENLSKNTHKSSYYEKGMGTRSDIQKRCSNGNAVSTRSNPTTLLLFT